MLSNPEVERSRDAAALDCCSGVAVVAEERCKLVAANPERERRRADIVALTRLTIPGNAYREVGLVTL